MIEMLESRRMLADVGLDLSFGELGTVSNSAESARLGVVQLSGGKFLTFGQQRVIFHNADGSLSGSRRLPFVALSAQRYADGTVLLAGVRDFANGGTFGPVWAARILPDGSYDPSFGTGGVIKIGLGGRFAIHKVGIVPLPNDAATLVVSYTISATETTPETGATVMLRLTARGALDESFAPGGKKKIAADFYSQFAPIPGDASGGFYLAGALDALHHGYLLRVLGDGTIDGSFDSHRLVGALPPSALAVEPDGKVLVATTQVGSAAIYRVGTNGQIDRSFGRQGSVDISKEGIETVPDLAVSPDGKFWVLAKYQSSPSVLYRFNPDSTLDESFDDDGVLPLSDDPVGGPQQIDLLSDGSGLLELGDLGVQRYNESSDVALFPSTLAVRGTEGDDTITIAPGGNGTINVTVNGQSSTFDALEIALVAILARGGDDSVSCSLDVPCHVDDGDGNDTITIGDGGALITAGNGADRITTGGRNDDVEVLANDFGMSTVSTGDGDDIVHGGGAISIDTGNGDDQVLDAMADSIDTGAGNDRIVGSFATLHAGDGNDVIISNGGGSLIDVGAGDDVVRVNLIGSQSPGNPLRTTVLGGDGNDILVAEAGDNVLDGGKGDDLIRSQGEYQPGDVEFDQTGFINFSTLIGGDGNDTIFSGIGVDELYGNAGKDQLHSEGSGDYLSGGGGHDRFFAGGSFTTLSGGSGNDTFLVANDGPDNVNGGDGDDTVQSSDASDVLRAVEHQA